MSAPAAETSKEPHLGQRPLSPFMIGPYYKPQLTSMLSITHRLTGVGLSLGALLLVTWLGCLAAGPECYARIAPHLAAWYGQAVLIAFTWALLFHFCNGIRHLIWDVGKGLEIKAAEKLGIAVVIFSLLLTGAVWAVAFSMKQGAL